MLQGANMEGKGTYTILDPLTRKLVTYDVHTGEVIAKEGALVPKSNFQYTLELGAGICALVREGKTLKTISELPNMPSLHLIYAWRNHYPDFKKGLEEAKQDRADYFHDKAAEAVEEVAEKEDVPVGKFKFDSYLKLAEKGNPREYGQKTQIEGQQGALQIVLHTGIVREKQEPITVEANYGEITEESARHPERSFDNGEHGRCTDERREHVKEPDLKVGEGDQGKSGACQVVEGNVRSKGEGEKAKGKRERGSKKATRKVKRVKSSSKKVGVL